MSLLTLEQQVLELPLQERAQLVRRLLQSLDGVSSDQAQQLWLDVAACRAGEIDRGAVQLVAAAELEDRVQALLK